MGVNYVLDMRSKRADESLREELKSRVSDSLKDQADRLRSLEQAQDKTEVRLMDKESIEQLI
jgi:ElaB/YqjD/DUF883 family membrane-anchored ribosome-binding protein